jgi:hypothetical protein
MPRACGRVPQGTHEGMNSQLTSAAAATIAIEDIKQWLGQDVLDPNGEKLGKLDQVFWDAELDIPTFAAVKSGTFAKRLTLVTLAGATAGRSHLRIGVDKGRFKKAPSFEPGAQLSAEDEILAYDYYGLEYGVPGAGARRLAKH